MSIPCRMIDVRRIVEEKHFCECGAPDCLVSTYRSERYADTATGQPPVPGDMFYAPWYGDQWLTPQYKAERRRTPIIVVLPNREWFCVDQCYVTDGGKVQDTGWTVSGTEPKLSLVPSINCVGRWHGYLTEGVLGDDVEGRTF